MWAQRPQAYAHSCTFMFMFMYVYSDAALLLLMMTCVGLLGLSSTTIMPILYHKQHKTMWKNDKRKEKSSSKMYNRFTDFIRYCLTEIYKRIYEALRTLQTLDISDPRQFGTSAEVQTLRPLPKMWDSSALVPNCLKDTSAPSRHHAQHMRCNSSWIIS